MKPPDSSSSVDVSGVADARGTELPALPRHSPSLLDTLEVSRQFGVSSPPASCDGRRSSSTCSIQPFDHELQANDKPCPWKWIAACRPWERRIASAVARQLHRIPRLNRAIINRSILVFVKRARETKGGDYP